MVGEIILGEVSPLSRGVWDFFGEVFPFYANAERSLPASFPWSLLACI